MLLRHLLRKICAKQPLRKPQDEQMKEFDNENAVLPGREIGKMTLLREKPDLDSGEDQLVTGWLFGFKRDSWSDHP